MKELNTQEIQDVNGTCSSCYASGQALAQAIKEFFA